MRFVDTPLARARPPELRARIDPNIKVPGAGTIQARTQLREGEDRFQLAGQLLQDCLEVHARCESPGRFKLVRLDNYGYSIVPTEVRGKSGEIVSASSPLDARISFPRAKRYLGPTLELITQAISKSTGEKIEADVHSLPGINTIYDVALTNSGADNEVAREVLARTLREMTEEYRPSLMMSWNLERSFDHDQNKVARLCSSLYKLHTHQCGRNQRSGVHWPDQLKLNNQAISGVSVSDYGQLAYHAYRLSVNPNNENTLPLVATHCIHQLLFA